MTRHLSIDLNETAVRLFAEQWPCFGDINAISFTFSAEGDLLDVTDPSDHRDGGGIVALSHDAFAAAKIADALRPWFEREGEAHGFDRDSLDEIAFRMVAFCNRNGGPAALLRLREVG